MKYFELDPQATLDYTINWADEVGSNQILTSVWTVPSGLTEVRSSQTDDTTTIFLTGGSLWEVYKVVNRITYGTGNNARTVERVLGIICTEMSELRDISILSGIDVDNIDAYWLVSTFKRVKTQLNRDFANHTGEIQYYDLRNRNDYVANYDRVRKFQCSKYPMTAFTSLIYAPDSDSPETLTLNTDYFVNLEEGTFELADTWHPSKGQRRIKATYAWGYADIPEEIKEYVKYLVAFALESTPAKNSDGVPLKEVEIGRYREAYATTSTALRAKYDMLPRLEQIITDKYKNWDL